MPVFLVFLSVLNVSPKNFGEGKKFGQKKFWSKIYVVKKKKSLSFGQRKIVTKFFGEKIS